MKHYLCGIPTLTHHRTRRIVSATVVLLVSAFLFSSVRAELSFSGSSTVSPLVAALTKGFELHTGIRSRITGGGSGTGIDDAISGQVDIGMSSRTLTEQELGSVEAIPLARDSFSIIVNKTNTITAVTSKQLKDIYQRRLLNWKDLGGKDMPVIAVLKESDRGSRKAFDDLLSLTIDNENDFIRIGPNYEAIIYTASDPAAIAYTSTTELRQAIAQGAAVKALRFNGVLPAENDIASGRYPLTRSLYLIPSGSNSDEVTLFLDYLNTAQARNAIRSNGYLPVD